MRTETELWHFDIIFDFKRVYTMLECIYFMNGVAP